VDIWKVTPTTIDVYVTHDDSNLSAYLPSNYTNLSGTLCPTVSLRDTVEELHDLKRKKKPFFNLTLLSHDFHEQYHSAQNVTQFLKSLVHTFPNHTSLMHIGYSYEGRKIQGIRIASPLPRKRGSKERKAFVIIGAQHAREWIATSTALYLAHALLVDPVQQTIPDAKHSLRRLLDQFEFHIIPLPNPDGYQYTRRRDRLWYKNRQPVSTGKGKAACKGMDMNRNWVRTTSCVCPHPDPSSLGIRMASSNRSQFGSMWPLVPRISSI
jgi:extracellular matrix protein 14